MTQTVQVIPQLIYIIFLVSIICVFMIQVQLEPIRDLLMELLMTKEDRY